MQQNLNNNRCIMASAAYCCTELLIALILAAILMLLVVPSWQTLLEQNATSAQSARIFAALEYTRMLAITTNQNVSFCRQSSSPKDVKDWSDGQCIKDASGSSIRTFSSSLPRNKVLWAGSFAKNNCLTFDALGIPNGQQGSFYVCPRGAGDDTNKLAMAIIVQDSGRMHARTASLSETRQRCK